MNPFMRMNLVLIFMTCLFLFDCVSAHFRGVEAVRKETVRTGVAYDEVGETSLVPVIRFPTDSDRVLKRDEPFLNGNVSWLKKNGWAVVVIEGHCDERGSAGYNMELGDRRARHVKSYLLERGVNPEQVAAIVSFGETRPLDKRHNSEAWRKNRRVEFKLR